MDTNSHYARKWQVMEDLEFELFDGNLVRIEWLSRDDGTYLAHPDQIRIHTTADSNPKRMIRFRKLRATKDYGSGWEPVIMDALAQVTDDLRNAPFDTFDDFIWRVFACFQELWLDAPEMPITYQGVEDESDTDGFLQERSPLIGCCRQEAVEEAVTRLRRGDEEIMIDFDYFHSWGEP